MSPKNVIEAKYPHVECLKSLDLCHESILYPFNQETESEFNFCQTTTPNPPMVANCSHSFTHLVEILDSPSASIRYSPGTYYLVSE